MASMVGGTVTWILDVETGKFSAGLASANAAVKTATSNVSSHTENIKSSFKNTATSVGNSLNSIANSIGGLTIATGLAIGTSSMGLLGMAKASWNQVVAVENASFALKAYEKDAGKVNQVLSELVKYAQSDMGVLFQRQDLFDAASNLKLYGIETNKLVDYTKILSKGVAVGKTSFQELSDIMGRVASSGQLTGDAFDMLVMRGIKLPDTMRNAKVSAEELFQALDKSLPDELLEGRANTISGIMTRLQSAFRNLGSQILGVDKDTSQFIKGGLGDTLVKTMENLRNILASPEVKEAFANLGKSIGNFVKDALPLLIQGFTWMANNLPTVIALFGALVTLFVALKVAAAVSFFLGLANPIQWVVIGIALLVGALIWLQSKFDIIGKAMEFLKPIFGFIGDLFKDLWKNVKSLGEVLGKELAPVFEFISKHAETFKKILMVIAVVALAPLIVGIGLVIGAIKLLSVVIGFIAKHFEVIKKVVLVILAVALAPFILMIGGVILAVKLLINVVTWLIGVFINVAQFIAAATSMIWNAVSTAFTFIQNIIMTVMNAIWSFIQPILSFILDLFTIVFGLILLGIITVFKTIWNVIVSVWNAIWGFLQPIVQTIWSFIVSAWNAIRDTAVSVFNALKDFFTTIWNTIYNTITGLVNNIINFFAPAWNWLYDKGKAIIQGLINGIENMAGALWGGISTVAAKIGEFFSGAWNWLYDTGKNIIQGLINGISNMAGAVQRKASEIADGVKNTIKNALKISSPSKVMFEFGGNISQGLANGISSELSRVQSASLGLTSTVQAPMVDMNSGQSNVTTNKTDININGNIMLNDKSAVDTFFAKLNRNNELAQKGMTLL